MTGIGQPASHLYAAAPGITSHHGQLWVGVPEEFIEHLDSGFDHRPDDVWLASYPRSGTAWTYEIINAILFDGDIDALTQAQQAGTVHPFFPLEVGSASSVTDRLAAWRTRPAPRVVPTHVPHRLFPHPGSGGRPIVYVVRDPRDVAVSFFHFHRSHRMLGMYEGSWDDFFSSYLRGEVVCGSWFDHTLGWVAAARQLDHVLLVRYDALKQDSAAQIRRIAGFLGRDLPDRAVAAVQEYTSFRSMSANPFTNRDGTPLMDLSVARFLRKGVNGDWRNHFTAEQEERFGRTWRERLREPAVAALLGGLGRAWRLSG